MFLTLARFRSFIYAKYKYEKSLLEEGNTLTAIYLQIIFAVIAIVYAVAIVFVTKSTYGIMRKRGVEEMVAVYYNRKIVHMSAGGVVALSVPFLFDSWVYPLAIGLALTLFTVLPRLQGKPMDFMQTKENWNDTKFTLMWGISIAVLWILFNNHVPCCYSNIVHGIWRCNNRSGA